MKTAEFPSVIAAGKAAKAHLTYYKKMMKQNPAQVAIDNLRELALYSPECFSGNVVDDELYNLVSEGSADADSVDMYGSIESSTLRRMYFLFMAEMLESNGGLPENKPTWRQYRDQLVDEQTSKLREIFDAPTKTVKPPFDGVSWLFENHWITYDDVLRVREAERIYNA